MFGQKAEFAFKPKSHVELCDSLAGGFRPCRKTFRQRFLYTNWGARWNGLIQFLPDLHTREHGYTEVSPPFMVGPECLMGVGHPQSSRINTTAWPRATRRMNSASCI